MIRPAGGHIPEVRQNRLRRKTMLSYIWPIALIVLSNTVYQICAKSVPEGMNPFASLTVTVSGVLYYTLGNHTGLLKEYGKLNWAPIILGIVIVGLEAGYIFAYKAGWQVSRAQVVQSVILAGALLLVGWLLYHEALTWNKIVGIVICLIGLVFINLKT